MKCKRETDARQVNREHMNTVRQQAVKAVRQGREVAEVAATFDVHQRTLYRWLSRVANEGQNGLLSKPKSGRTPKVTEREMRWVAGVVRDANPQQWKFAYALWSLRSIQQLIRDQLGKNLSRGTVHRLMRLLGFSPQKPLRRAYERDAALVAQWERETYPTIKAKARRVGAKIFFADEAGLRSDYHAGTSWAPKGETPVVETTGQRFSVNMVSAVSPRGDLRFMVHQGRFNAGVFLTFLQRLYADAEAPIFVIVDGHRAHRAQKVQRWIDSTQGQVQLFFLPPYAPQLNPDETVWSYVKSEVGKSCPDSLDQLQAHARAILHRIQKLPALVRSFFAHPACRYAMDGNTS